MAQKRGSAHGAFLICCNLNSLASLSQSSRAFQCLQYSVRNALYASRLLEKHVQKTRKTDNGFAKALL